MVEWSSTAEEKLQAYVNGKRAALCDEGADPAEVHADLHAHIETTVGESGRSVVTAEDVTGITGTVNPEPTEPAPPRRPPQTSRGHDSRTWSLKLGFFGKAWVVIFGIRLPLITLLVELALGGCSDILFDPTPSWFHAFLVALVPRSTPSFLFRSTGLTEPEKHSVQLR